MSLFTIDENKCQRDGICVAECPAKIIIQKDPGSVPVPVKGAEKGCINCGHCVAVCPHGALSLKTMTVDQCPPVKTDWLPSRDFVEHFLRSRRSIRTYKKETVDRVTLMKLIEIARYAPSGHNSQPVKWLVIHDRSQLDRLISLTADWMENMIREKPQFAGAMNLDKIVAAQKSGLDMICRGAPHVIVAYGRKDFPPAQTACIIALTYLELSVSSFGLGACWAGFFNTAASLWPPMAEELSLPAGHASYGSMMVGYPEFRYHRLPLRKAPRITWK